MIIHHEIIIYLWLKSMHGWARDQTVPRRRGNQGTAACSIGTPRMLLQVGAGPCADGTVSSTEPEGCAFLGITHRSVVLSGSTLCVRRIHRIIPPLPRISPLNHESRRSPYSRARFNPAPPPPSLQSTMIQYL